MTTIRTSILAGLAISTAVIFGSLSTAAAETGRPMQAAAAPNGFPAARCSRPLDQEAERIKRLEQLVNETTAETEKNPLLWASVGYYKTELAATRRCLQAVASH
jgi:hypothetical protein